MRAAGSLEERTARERILDSAERLFANKGFAGTSVRAITAEAGVNLASAHYYFGSKKALIRSVFERRVAPITRERLQMLERCLAAAGEAPPDLGEIINAFVRPALMTTMGTKAEGPHLFTRLLGRAYSEPGGLGLEIVRELFTETARRFTQALMRALPPLSREEILWRFQFMVGAMAFTLAAPQIIQEVSQGACDACDAEEVLSHLVPFIAAGMRSGAVPLSTASTFQASRRRRS